MTDNLLYYGDNLQVLGDCGELCPGGVVIRDMSGTWDKLLL